MKRIFTVFMAALFAVALFTCEELESPVNGNGDENGDGNGDGTVPELTAQELVDSANVALGQLMSQMVNNPPEPPFDGDYSGMQQVNDLYNQALEKDANHTGANFGAGLTVLLLLVEDGSTFMEEIERWEAFMDTTTFFGDSINQESGTGKVLAKQSNLITTNPFSVESVPKISATSYLKAMTSLPKYAQEDPKFSDWQDLIESTILERVNNAIANLAVVEEEETFQFVVTPEMQGDPEAPTREIDLTEVYMFDAVLHGIQAVCNMVIAYDVNLSPYDSNAFDRLEPGGTFMELRKDGAMTAALDAIHGLLDKADAGLVFLESEDDDQSDDIIIIGEGNEDQPGIPQDTLLIAQSIIDSVRTVFSGPVEIDLTQEEQQMMKPAVATQGDLADNVITVNISKLFDPEIQDFKAFLPGYTIVAGMDTSYKYLGEEGEVEGTYEEPTTATINVGEPGNYYFNFLINWESSGATNVLQSDYNIYIPEFEAAAWDSLYSLVNTDLPEGQRVSWVNVGIWWSYEFTEAGVYDIEYHIEYQYGIDEAYMVNYYPVPIWDAANYDEWIGTFSSDPSLTFFGVFPNFEQADWEAIFMEMGITETTWEKDMRNFNPPQY